jgi:two-component system LytT family response regulator
MNQVVKAIIVDDEEFARENLKMFVEDFCPEVSVMALAPSAREAYALIEELDPDLVFLDIMMPGDDGFSLLSRFEERRFSVIFTTAHNEHALRAIKEDAVDYLEKPINIEELQGAVKKAASLLELKKGANLSDERLSQILENLSMHNPVEKTAIPTRDGYAIVKNADIIHLEANESYTNIYLTGDRKFLSSKTIKVYEDRLSKGMFFRTHKSHIINITHHLKEFNRTAGNYAVMSNDAEIPISRRKLPTFLSRISGL